jgi:hypothetical protein
LCLARVSRKKKFHIWQYANIPPARQNKMNTVSSETKVLPVKITIPFFRSLVILCTYPGRGVVQQRGFCTSMRCAQCGLPLSPKRNSCPRCGTPINTSNPAKAEGSLIPASALVPQLPFSTPQHSFEDSQSVSPSEPAPQANMPAPYPANNLPDRSGQSPARKPYPSTPGTSKTTIIGFTSAGLCIFAGTLLLFFVYLIGQGFLPAGTTPTSDTQLSNMVKANQTATVTYHSKPSTPPITPTPTLPGQGLLDIAVLSNDFNGTQPLTDFKVNQTIYVVLSLHPGSNSRAICLNWYLNDQLVKNFAFDVINPTYNYHYYSYTTMPTTGSGRVDISLASTTTACTDAIMAKKLAFTVTA